MKKLLFHVPPLWAGCLPNCRKGGVSSCDISEIKSKPKMEIDMLLCFNSSLRYNIALK
jgi:hypothetical protein